MICSALIVAAGNSTRMGTGVKKQFMNLDSSEKPIIAYTIEKFENCNLIDNIILVTSDIDYCKEIIKKYHFKKILKIVNGGKERQDSVYNGFKCLDENTDIVLIHDGVRPFVDIKCIENTIKFALEYGSGVLGVKTTDTVKICDNENFIESTPDRSKLWNIQTPQTFKYDILKRAFESAYNENFIATDESTLVEKSGVKVKVVEGSYKNIKITTSEDIIISKILLQNDEFFNKKIKDNKIVDIFTDGACSGNPGQGGYGVVILYNGLRKEFSQGFKNTTNNRMEILAVIKALEALKESCDVNLYSDSKYVVDAILKGWLKKWEKNNWKRDKNHTVLNIDLWKRIVVLLKKHNVTFIWIKGHAENAENERCDFLARQAIKSGNLIDDENYN